MKRLIIYISLAFAFSACTKVNPIQNLSSGQYASAPDTVSIVIKNYNPQPGNVLQDYFLSNASVIVSQGQLLYSSARDGMADSEKQSLISTYGFSVTSPESVVSGFADLVLYELGIDITQQNLMYCASSQMASSSNDALVYNDDRQSGNPTVFLGLRDCEKAYLNLNPSKFDFAGNGIPDYLKIQCGINPTNLDSAFISTAGDGVSNLDKCKRHIPVAESASTQPNQLYAYRYSKALNADGSYDLTVNNIPVLNAGAENLLEFYLVEANVGTNQESLSTAFAVLKAGYVNGTIQVPYWGVDTAHLLNQQVNIP